MTGIGRVGGGGGEKGTAYMIFVGKPKKERDDLEDIVMGDDNIKIALKFYGRLWTGFLYFRIGKIVYNIYPSGFIKCEEFLDWLISLLGFSKRSLICVFNWVLV